MFTKYDRIVFLKHYKYIICIIAIVFLMFVSIILILLNITFRENELSHTLAQFPSYDIMATPADYSVHTKASTGI